MRKQKANNYPRGFVCVKSSCDEGRGLREIDKAIHIHKEIIKLSTNK